MKKTDRLQWIYAAIAPTIILGIFLFFLGVLIYKALTDFESLIPGLLLFAGIIIFVTSFALFVTLVKYYE